MQPTRKQPNLIEIYDICNPGGYGTVRMLAIFHGNLAAERNNVIFVPSFQIFAKSINRTDTQQGADEVTVQQQTCANNL